MDLSILIVNWNTRSLLQDCLQSLYDHWSGIDPEIIVVDNASTDGSVEMVREQFPEVAVIANADNVGFVRANNQGAAIARGRYLLLLNSDTRVLDSDVSRIIDYLDSHREVGIATGSVLNADGSIQHTLRRDPHPLGALMRHSFRLALGFNTYFHRRFRMEGVDPGRERDIDWVVGCYVFLRREILDNGKVFDEDIYMYYEDTLLCSRCRTLGFRVRYLPLASIIHYGGGSARQIRTIAAWNSFRSSVIYFSKTRGSATAATYSFAVRSVWRALAAFFAVMAALFGARFRRKADYFAELLSLARKGSGH